MKKKKEPRQDILYANEKSKHGDLNTKRIPAAEMGERVALTDVIIHSGQKTVSRYIRPVVMHHVALYPREQKCPANVTRILLACYAVRELACPSFLERFPARIHSVGELIPSTLSANLSFHRHWS